MRKSGNNFGHLLENEISPETKFQKDLFNDYVAFLDTHKH